MAKNYSFYEVLNSNNESDPNMFNLRQRCLIPGLYYDHLSRWLKEFKYNQIYLLCTENIKVQPYSELNKIQSFLGYTNAKINFNFKQVLEISEVVNDNTTFNKYSEIDQRSYLYLYNFYSKPNSYLKALVNETDFFYFKLPEWLSN